MALYAKCDICKQPFSSTKGKEPPEQIDSLITNIFNHIKKRHPEVAEGIAESLLAVQGMAIQLIMMDYLDEHDSKSGKETTEILDAHADHIAGEVCELMGIEDVETEGDEDAEEEEEGEGLEVVTEEGDTEEGKVIEIDNKSYTVIPPPDPGDDEPEPGAIGS